MLGVIFVMCIALVVLFCKEVTLENTGYDKQLQQESGEKEDTVTNENVPEKDVEIEYIDKTILENLEKESAGTIIQKDRISWENVDCYFTQNEINDKIYARIQGKSYPEDAKISLNELRYIKVLHYNYNHEIQVGELIVNRGIAQDCVDIFRELFEIEYEVESMRLIDDYWTGDSVDSDTNSISYNNTSSFNYRVVPGSSHLSNHAKGRAIDINPLQNPYVKYNSDGSFAHYYKDMELYLDRNSGKKHMITHEDECYKIFKKYGFTWGGDWNSVKDYQHFEKE